MNLIIRVLRIYVPEAVKKRRLRQLFRLTADAFQTRAPDTSCLSFDRALLQYALFTREEAEKAIQRDQGLPAIGQDHCPPESRRDQGLPESRQDRGLSAIRERLYQNAYQLGMELRKALRVKAPQQVVPSLKLIYRMLGIELSGHFPGEVLITRCFFSRFYSNEVCQVISALDAGLAAGLSGGGSLAFDQRITEGKDCCRARFVWDRLREDCT